MPPSLFNHQSQECYVRTYQQQDGVDKRSNNETTTRRRSSLILSVPDRFVRDWTWSRKWPLAPISEECDSDMQATLTCSGRESKLITSQNKKKKVVSFSPCVDGCRPVLHVDDMSEQQKMDMWWTLDDFAMMRKMIGVTLRRAKALGCLDDHDEGFCLRGIEAMSTKTSQRRKERRRAALETVLRCQQQHKSKSTGYVDSEYVAHVYAAFCEPDKITSLLKAVSDAADATAILLAEP